MKKFAPIVAIALLGMMFTSCKKEYTCSCSYNFMGVTGSGDVKSSTKLSKSEAKDWCENYSVSGWSSISCSLK